MSAMPAPTEKIEPIVLVVSLANAIPSEIRLQNEVQWINSASDPYAIKQVGPKVEKVFIQLGVRSHFKTQLEEMLPESVPIEVTSADVITSGVKQLLQAHKDPLRGKVSIGRR